MTDSSLPRKWDNLDDDIDDLLNPAASASEESEATFKREFDEACDRTEELIMGRIDFEFAPGESLKTQELREGLSYEAVERRAVAMDVAAVLGEAGTDGTPKHPEARSAYDELLEEALCRIVVSDSLTPEERGILLDVTQTIVGQEEFNHALNGLGNEGVLERYMDDEDERYMHAMLVEIVHGSIPTILDRFGVSHNIDDYELLVKRLSIDIADCIMNTDALESLPTPIVDHWRQSLAYIFDQMGLTDPQRQEILRFATLIKSGGSDSSNS